MQIESTMQQLDYFSSMAIHRYPGASDAQLAEAMATLGVTFPPSLQAFLQMTNGLLAIEYRFLGLGHVGEPGDLVESTRQWREEMDRDDLLVVAEDLLGNAYVLLTGDGNAESEWPVAFLDHENPRADDLVASSFERFCWFAFDDLRRQFQPDGEEREGGKPSGWPYRNKAWILKQDPALKALWNPPKPAAARQQSQQKLVGTMQSDTPIGSAQWTAGGTAIVLFNWTQALVRTAAGRPIADVELGAFTPDAALSPDHRCLVTGRREDDPTDGPGALQWWEMANSRWWGTSKPRCRAEIVPEQSVRSLAFSHDGAWLAVGLAHSVLLYPHGSTTPAQRIELAIAVQQICFSPDARLLAVAGTRKGEDDDRGEISLWDYVAGACEQTLDLKFSSPLGIEFSADASLLACAAMNKNATAGEVMVWRGFAKKTTAIHLKKLKEIPDTLAISPDASLLVTGYYLDDKKHSEVFCWDIRGDGELLTQLTLPGSFQDAVFIDVQTIALLVKEPSWKSCHIYHWQLG